MPCNEETMLLRDYPASEEEENITVSLAIKILGEIDSRLRSEKHFTLQRVLETVRRTKLADIQNILSQKPTTCNCPQNCLMEFTCANQNHQLHDYFTDLTTTYFNQLPQTVIKELWKNLLGMLHLISVHYSYKGSVRLDFSRELHLLDNPNFPCHPIEILTFRPDEIPEIMQNNLDEIDQESFFGTDPKYPSYWKWAKIMNRALAYIAVDKISRSVLGVLVTQKGPPKVIWIAYLARKANAAKLGIGNMLLSRAINDAIMTNRQAVKTRFRQSNQKALRIFDKYGLQIKNLWSNFYRNPKENAIVMERKISVSAEH